MLPVVLGAISVVVSTVRREGEIASAQVRRWARTVADHHDQLAAATEALLIALSRTDEVRSPLRRAECQALLQQLVSEHGEYGALGVTDASGRVVCSTLADALGTDLGDRRYVREALERRTFSGGDYQVGRITGRPGIIYGYPVSGDDGRARGVVFAALDLDWLSRWTVRAGVPPGTALLVIDTTGLIAYRYPDNAQYSGRYLPAGVNAAALAPGVREGIVSALGLDGIERMFAFVAEEQPGGASRYRMVVGIPLSEAYALSYRIGRRATVFVLVLLTGALVIAWILSDRLITQRVSALATATQRIARGDLSARTGIADGEDELAQLARSFDAMAAVLEKNDAELRRNERHNRLLAQASRALSAAPDYDDMLQEFARVLVPAFADFCALEIHDSAGGTARYYEYPLSRGELTPADTVSNDDVFRTGQPFVHSSLLMVPLRASGDVLGVLTLAHQTPERAFDDVDRQLALELARRVALAVENARLYHELEARVRARTAELTALNRELEAFSYSVSHDLRSPLRSMDGFSQALLEDYSDVLDDTGRDYLQRIRQGAQRMGLLIDDLLSLSRVARADLNRTDVDVTALAESVVRELRQAEPQRNVAVTIAPGMTAFADPGLLRLALQNLIGNAWKFTGKKAEARIEIGARDVDGSPAFYVRDNGAGFDMAYAGKLFTPFQRLHSMNEFAGTGIGLATVQRIVARHGGRVWADAKPDAGATFTFTLG